MSNDRRSRRVAACWEALPEDFRYASPNAPATDTEMAADLLELRERAEKRIEARYASYQLPQVPTEPYVALACFLSAVVIAPLSVVFGVLLLIAGAVAVWFVVMTRTIGSGTMLDRIKYPTNGKPQG